jgi:hypothetical protein
MITYSYIPDCIHTAGFRFHIDPDWIHSFGYEMSDWRLSVLDRPHILFCCIYALDTRIVVEVRILIELTTARTLRCRIAVSSLSHPPCPCILLFFRCLTCGLVAFRHYRP